MSIFTQYSNQPYRDLGLPVGNTTDRPEGIRYAVRARSGGLIHELPSRAGPAGYSDAELGWVSFTARSKALATLRGLASTVQKRSLDRKPRRQIEAIGLQSV